jgi:hypothetical protein
MTYFGFSGYGVSVAALQKLVAIMQGYHMNTIRISGTPPWQAQGSHALKFEYVDFILDNTDFNVIVDPNHLYNPTTGYTSTDFIANIASARARLLEFAQRYKDNPRVFIEIVNEYTESLNGVLLPGEYGIVQGLINDVRAVCNNPLVWDIMWPVKTYQPLIGGSIFQGEHDYFGPSQSNAATVFQRMKDGAAAYGLSFLCTEVGADWNEGAAFTQQSVDTLNQFLNDCNDNSFGVMIWLRELQGEDVNPNLIAYRKYGLKIPSDIVPPPPPVTYLLDVWVALGGTTTPTGIESVLSGTIVKVTATAAEGYKFGGWQVQVGTEPVITYPATVNPLILTVTAATTVMPLFSLVPVPPSCPAGTHWDSTVNACVQDTPSQNNLAAGAVIGALVVVGVLYVASRKKR